MDEIRIDDIDGDRLTVKDATTGARRILGVIAKEIDAGHTSEWVPLLLDTAAVATLRDALTAWLDAPRDAARAEAEPVTRADGYILAKTTLGEWGVAEEGEIGAAWSADEDQARGHFAAVRGFVRCEGCKAEVSFDDHDTSADVVLCPGCAGGLVTA